MAASDSMFDFWGWVFGIKLSNEDIAEIERLREVAMAANFSTNIGSALCSTPQSLADAHYYSAVQ